MKDQKPSKTGPGKWTERRGTDSNQTAKDDPTSRRQIRTKAIQPPPKTGSNYPRPTKIRPLQAESLPTPLQPQGITTLWMWIWKGDGRTLPHGCRRYKEQRKEMQKEIRGSLGKWRIKLERLLGDPKVVKHTLKFVKETARLKTT